MTETAVCAQCGYSFVERLGALKPFVSRAGKISINKLIQAVGDLRVLLELGDKQRTINSEGNRADELRYLATATADPSLQQLFILFSEICSFVAYILQFINDPFIITNIVCQELEYKAQRLEAIELLLLV